MANAPTSPLVQWLKWRDSLLRQSGRIFTNVRRHLLPRQTAGAEKKLDCFGSFATEMEVQSDTITRLTSAWKDTNCRACLSPRHKDFSFNVWKKFVCKTSMLEWKGTECPFFVLQLQTQQTHVEFYLRVYIRVQVQESLLCKRGNLFQSVETQNIQTKQHIKTLK